MKKINLIIFYTFILSAFIMPNITYAADPSVGPIPGFDQFIGTFTPPDKTSSDPNAVNNYIGTIINTSLFIGLIATLIYIVYGGVKWISAGGDAKALASAKDTITHAIVGLILLSVAFAVAVIFRNTLYRQGDTPGGTPGGQCGPSGACDPGYTCSALNICLCSPSNPNCPI